MTTRGRRLDWSRDVSHTNDAGPRFSGVGRLYRWSGLLSAQNVCPMGRVGVISFGLHATCGAHT